MARKPQLGKTPTVDNTELHRFLRDVKFRGEIEDGLHDRDEQKLTVSQLREALIAAGITGAENIE